mgnify:CR=1 FL=1
MVKTELKMETILITGGNGLIGRHLSEKLKKKGYRVTTLSRSAKISNRQEQYFWDPENDRIDPEAVAGADYIIHLAGANLGEKRWSSRRKETIINSRVKTAELLFQEAAKNPLRLKVFISSSAIGYYGAITRETIFRESDPPSPDFLGETCRLWEESASRFEDEGIRTIVLRTGVVLTSRGGALAKMTPLVRFGLGSPLGSGQQYLPWIHIDDLCNIYIKAVEDISMKGVYNAVAPEIPTNRAFYRTLARVLKRPLLLSPVPAFLLKAVLGEMSVMLLEGSRVSPEKIISAGFDFRFPMLEGALFDLLSETPEPGT